MNYILSYSTSTNPYLNLAREYELIANAKAGETHLFLYRNDASIVIGRFQNPWREVNFLNLPEHVHVVRRHSGGGTVYHDLGNWNFSFVCGDQKINEIKNLSLITKILKNFGIDLLINERFDLIANDHGVRKKVSGSAFRKTKSATLHHGTLLIDADLQSLGRFIGKDSTFKIDGKGVFSVPSPVMNLLDSSHQNLNWDNFIIAFEKEIGDKSQVWCDQKVSNFVRVKQSDLSSWEWMWGQGPKFNLIVKRPAGLPGQLLISSNKGVIEDCQLYLDHVSEELIKTRFLNKTIGKKVKTTSSILAGDVQKAEFMKFCLWYDKVFLTNDIID